jgi:transposase
MEAHVIDWLHEASHSGVSRVTGFSWDQTSVIMKNAVHRGLERRKSIAATKIGVDEKCRSTRQDYVTIVIDHEEGSVLHVADGRGKESLASYFKEIGPEACAQIEVVTMDMSAAYIATTKEFVPDADQKICIDRFHVSQHISKAVDQVRRQENKELVSKGDDRLKRTKFLWLKNLENQTLENLARFKKLEKTSLVTAKAWRVKEIARHLFEWTAWCMKAVATKMAPMIRVAETVGRHMWNIANAIALSTSNAKSESFNAAVQKVSTRAHGFRNNDHFREAIYFHLGKLDMYPDGVVRT